MSTAEILTNDFTRRDFLLAPKKRSPKIIKPHSSLNQPKPPEKPSKIGRRLFIGGGIIFATGIAAGIIKPWELLTQDYENTLPPATPEPKILNTQIIESARREVFKLEYYPTNLRQKMVNFWLKGEKATEYKKDGQSYLFSFDAANPNPKMKDMAITEITLGRRGLSTGGSALVFTLAGFYNPLLEEGLPESITRRIKAMNFEHEAIVSTAYINGSISVGKDLSLDFGFPSEPQPEEPLLLTRFKAYIPIITAYAEAVAEINDYILTFPLLDKDPHGQILFINYPRHKNPLPMIAGKVFIEGGLTYIVDQNIGTTLKGIGDLDQLAQRYPSLESIPRSLEYIKQIQQHFHSPS